MPMNYSVDQGATLAAINNGLLKSEDSCITMPDSCGVVHVVLEHEDRSDQWARLYVKAKGKCAICKTYLRRSEACMHHPGWCDCISTLCSNALELRCRPETGRRCHDHTDPKFQRRSA
jgi:hypothetical protein